ncbi:MAG: FAD-dependent oxidoreductase, partial [Candidatus Nanopelagicales bacterium]
MSEEAIEHAAVDGPVLVIGTGLIGTSIALALSRAGVDVALEDADASALQEAVYRGAGSVLTDHDPSIVVVAVPPAVAASQMADASRRFGSATIT